MLSGKIVGPYVGLVPFHEGQEKFFFGREADEELIATNLRAAPLTVLYGASGVGKSSVIQAGVVPRLRDLSTMSGLSEEQPTFLPVIVRDWVGDPVGRLRYQISESIRIAADGGSIREGTVAKIAAAHLESEKGRNVPALISSWAKLAKVRFLFVLDQFEEFLRPEFFNKERDFVEGIATSINNPQVPAHFLISMRDDALSRLDLFQGKLQGSINNTLRLKPLSRNAAEAAITKPLKTWDPAFEIEPDLVDEILWRVRAGNIKLKTQGQGGAGTSEESVSREERDYYVEAPYLQIVLQRLWQEQAGETGGSRKLSMSILEKIAGRREAPVEWIVETHLDRVFGGFDPADQDILSDFIHYTVPREGTKILSTPEGLADWARMSSGKAEPIGKILNKLTKLDPPIFRRVPEGDPKAREFMLVHDALGPAILSWRSRYEESDTNRFNERVKKIAPWVGALVLIGLITGVFVLYSQNQKITHALDDAKNERDRIGEDKDNQEDLLMALRILLDKQIIDKSPALTSLAELDVKGALSPEIKGIIGELVAASDQKDNANIAQVLFTNPVEAKPRVVIQIYDDSQRTTAVQVRNLLSSRFAPAKGIQTVANNYPLGHGTQVRYFHAEDAPMADQLARQLNTYGIGDASSFPFLKLADAPDNQLEIWFSPDAFDHPAQTKNRINMRSSPEVKDNNIVTEIPVQTTLAVRFCLPTYKTLDGKSGRWCQAVYGGSSGWVFDYFLSGLDSGRISAQ